MSGWGKKSKDKGKKKHFKEQKEYKILSQCLDLTEVYFVQEDKKVTAGNHGPLDSLPCAAQDPAFELFSKSYAN